MVASNKNRTLDELFLDELRDIYDGEKQLVDTLPQLARTASNPDLRSAIEHHLEETRQQVARLEEVFDISGATKQRKECTGIQGLLSEGRSALDQEHDARMRDAVLIASAQKVEHYEIATYGTLCAWAKLMGYSEAASVLHQTLEEEKAADEKLTQIAKDAVNLQAV